MKCIKNLSIGSLFEGGNSKKFTFKSIAENIRDNNPGMTKDRAPRYPGQSHTNQDIRQKMFQVFAQAEVLERKNELGLILDLIASCLDMDPKKRPTIQGMLHSPLFQMDNYELTNAVRFSQNVILYRSPVSSVSLRITSPLRAICQIAIKNPSHLFNIENDILRLFVWTEECITHITSLPLDQINEVLTQEEKRKALMMGSSLVQSQFKGKDFSQLRVSPNSPLAAQIIEDKVIDMLIFLTFRYTKAFNEWKSKRIHDIQKETQGIIKQGGTSVYSQATKSKKSVKFGGADSAVIDQSVYTDRMSQYQTLN
jgi:serine/threonine protein kinase